MAERTPEKQRFSKEECLLQGGLTEIAQLFSEKKNGRDAESFL